MPMVPFWIYQKKNGSILAQASRTIFVWSWRVLVRDNSGASIGLKSQFLSKEKNLVARRQILYCSWNRVLKTFKAPYLVLVRLCLCPVSHSHSHMIFKLLKVLHLLEHHYLQSNEGIYNQLFLPSFEPFVIQEAIEMLNLLIVQPISCKDSKSTPTYNLDWDSVIKF